MSTATWTRLVDPAFGLLLLCLVGQPPVKYLLRIMSLTKPAIDAHEPERRAAELLAEWLAGYFDGAAHAISGVERTLPNVQLLFNQAELPDTDPDDTARPQRDRRPILHGAFLESVPVTDWWRESALGTWSAVLATPAAGVSYGLCEGQVIESIHGAPTRSIPGTDIRWQASGADLLEQVFNGSWGTVRTLTNATALRWTRDGDDYVENKVAANASLAEVRRITPADPVWDGAMKRVRTRLVIGWWIRVTHEGSGPRAEWAARSVASALESLMRDPVALAPLTEKGMRDWRVLHGSRPLPTTGAAVRYLGTVCHLEAYIPREHTT